MLAIGLDIEADLVLPHKSMLDDALAAAIKGAGLHFGTWIVDDPDELDKLARFGLTGVGTNDPGGLLDHLAPSRLIPEQRTPSGSPMGAPVARDAGRRRVACRAGGSATANPARLLRPPATRRADG